MDFDRAHKVAVHPAFRCYGEGARDEYGSRIALSCPFVLSERKAAMASGTVKWFNDAKGYGFIAPDDGGKDVFVHHSNIAGEGFRSLSEGAKVEFEVQQGQKGPEATTVSLVG
jgi:CspA family cold shock protein